MDILSRNEHTVLGMLYACSIPANPLAARISVDWVYWTHKDEHARHLLKVPIITRNIQSSLDNSIPKPVGGDGRRTETPCAVRNRAGRETFLRSRCYLLRRAVRSVSASKPSVPVVGSGTMGSVAQYTPVTQSAVLSTSLYCRSVMCVFRVSPS